MVLGGGRGWYCSIRGGRRLVRKVEDGEGGW